jgi:hypothetical protein
MINKCKVKPIDLYETGAIHCRYIEKLPGEDDADTFLRVYNENVICCC